MILAELSGYRHWWQPFVLLAYVAATLYLGGRVLHGSLVKQAGQAAEPAKRKITLGRCCLAVFLALLAAGACGGAVYFLMSQMGSTGDSPFSWWAPIVVGAIVAMPAFALMVVAMFKMPLGQLLPGAGKALGVVVVATAICGTAVGVPAYYDLVEHRERADSADHLHRVFGYLQEASNRFTKAMPGDLASLQKLEKFDPQLLKCSRRPQLDIGYFYCSPGSEAMLKANPLSKTASPPPGGDGLIACEFKDSTKGGRIILMRNGIVQWLAEDEFQDTLNKKINEDFRKELAKVEK